MTLSEGGIFRWMATPWHPAPGDPGAYFDLRGVARTVLGHTVVALGQARTAIESMGDGQQEAQVSQYGGDWQADLIAQTHDT